MLDTDQILSDTIFYTRTGSHVYGTATPDSDEDFRGIVVLRDPWQYLALRPSTFEQKEKWDQFKVLDAVIYEARKALWLMLKSNPNMLELLFIDRRHWLATSPPWELIHNIRHAFLSKAIFAPFAGYARHSLKRVRDGTLRGEGDVRRKMIHQYGYDTKDASHLIRLLRVCRDALATGILEVTRFDAAELLEIRLGLWNKDRVLTEADMLYRQAEKAHASSRLPDHPDVDAVNKVWREIVRTHIGMQPDQVWPVQWNRQGVL